MEYQSIENTRKARFTLKQQREIGEAVHEAKLKYDNDKSDPKINVAKWNEKKKKWVYPFTQVGYTASQIILKPSRCSTN